MKTSLLGRWPNYRLEAKGRACIPSLFRDFLKRGVIATLASDGGLLIYSSKRVGEFQPSETWRVKIRGNRISLPSKLLKLTSLRKMIVWTGEGDHLVISPQKSVGVMEMAIGAASILNREAKALAGKEIPYADVGPRDLLVLAKLGRHGIFASGDGDREVFVLKTE